MSDVNDPYLSSHIDTHTHVGSAFDHLVTLTFNLDLRQRSSLYFFWPTL